MQLVINSKFRPFTYDELIKPMLQYKEAYDKAEADYTTLAAQTEQWKNIANRTQSPKAYAMYSKYSSALSNASEDFSKGMTLQNRGALLDLKQRYASEIKPIADAAERRKALIEEQRQLKIKDPTRIFQTNAADISLDSLIDNPYLDYGNTLSGAMITAQASAAAQALSKEMQDNPRKWRSILGNSYYETFMQKGFTSADVLEAIKNSDKANEKLKTLVENIVDSSGVKSWNSQAATDAVYAAARQGLWNAVGETQYQTLDNWRAKMAEEEKAAARRAATTTAGTTTLRDERGAPVIPEPLISSNKEGLKNGLKTRDNLLKITGVSGTRRGIYGRVNVRFDTSYGWITGGKAGRPNAELKSSAKDGKFKIWDSKGNLISKTNFIAQVAAPKDTGELAKRALKAKRSYAAKAYDNLVAQLKATVTPTGKSKSKYTIFDVQNQVSKYNKNAGALRMDAIPANMSESDAKEAGKRVLGKTLAADGDSFNGLERISNFDKDGNIITDKRKVHKKEFYDDNNNLRDIPQFYFAPSSKSQSLIMRFNGNMYAVPFSKVAPGMANAKYDVEKLKYYNQLRNQLITQYGEDAYYNSTQGQRIEDNIDRAGRNALNIFAQSTQWTIKTTPYESNPK